MRVLAGDHDDQQHVCHDSASKRARIYTVNIVDRSLLAAAQCSTQTLYSDALCSARTSSVYSGCPKHVNSAHESSASSNPRTVDVSERMSYANPDCGEDLRRDTGCSPSASPHHIRSFDATEDSARHQTSALPSAGSGSLAWGDRYFEAQQLDQCGKHALNNLVGGPQFQHSDLVTASLEILSSIGDAPSEHVHANGWYSHSVLATALQNTVPPRWRLLLQPLTSDHVFHFLHSPTVLGALVNIRNQHWIAIVKHAACLWIVDSLQTPVPLSENEFLKHLHLHPFTYPLVANEYDG